MAGHSKWANIRFRKGAQDVKRGKLFTKLIREITVSTRVAGPDPAANPRLRTAVDKALSNNMPRDTIDRAIHRGSGTDDNDNYEEIVYEGYGPYGVAVLVECLSDNRNRTVSEVRHAFAKHGGNLGTNGSVAFLFTKVGVLNYPVGSHEEKIMEAAIEAGAEDIAVNDDSSIDVTTRWEDFITVKEAMCSAGCVPENADVVMQAATMVEITDVEQASDVNKLMDALEDLDDVQKVHTNADISDAVMAQL